MKWWILAALWGVLQTGVDRWLGSWETIDNATLDVVRDTVDPSHIKFHFLVTTPAGCTGEASGWITERALAKTAVTLKAGLPDQREPQCQMTLKLTTDGDLIVDEGDCSDLHGAACSFSGRYSR